MNTKQLAIVHPDKRGKMIENIFYKYRQPFKVMSVKKHGSGAKAVVQLHTGKTLEVKI